MSRTLVPVLWLSSCGRKQPLNYLFFNSTASNDFRITGLTSCIRANSNVIPLSLWMLFEVAKSPSLLLALREELNTAYTTDPSTGTRTLNLHKFFFFTLLTSVYTETLRLSMSFNVVRNVSQTFTLDGWKIPKGAFVQAPTLVAHYDEDVWGIDGHPASEFWAERHIRYVDETDEEGKVGRKRVFDMGGRSGSYFPYGEQTFPGSLNTSSRANRRDKVAAT